MASSFQTHQAGASLRGPDVAVIVERTIKTLNRKKFNIIASGIYDSGSEKDDSAIFVSLCDNYLNIKPNVVRSKRLGRVDDVTDSTNNSRAPRQRLLLVTLSSEEEVAAILRVAKHLRESYDETVRASVFLNKDMTKKEVKAA